MSEQDNNKDQNKEVVDLSELSNLQFATAWTPSSNQDDRGSAPRKGGRPFDRDGDRRGERRDFKKGPRKEGDFANRGKPRFGDRNDRGKSGDKDGRPPFRKPGGKPFDRRKSFAPFKPTMEVLFYPDDAPFNKLSGIMKESKRTYQLFDIAELVLEKPDRFIILAKNLPDKEGAVRPLFCAQPMNLPFENEQDAKNAALEYYLGELFEKGKIEVEAPKGSFQVVNKCGITGGLLGAPNWHRYGEHLREYHRENCPNVSFETFTSSIESIRDEEQISAWLEQMKVRDVYKLKTPEEGENDTFETRDAAMNYVARKMGAELVKSYEQVRMKGSNIAMLPTNGRIRRNIEDAWNKQKRFPIVTANNLRGRLRRSGFAVYKRGSKGFAFVSAIKRKFLFEGDSLADAPQKIFEFILANPGVPAGAMPYKFLGIKPPATIEKGKTLAEESKTEAAEEAQSEPETATGGISAEDREKLSSAWSELAWLVSEGYVVEYADTTLQANPYLPRPKAKDCKAEDQNTENLGAADEPVFASKAKEQPEEPAAETPEKSEAEIAKSEEVAEAAEEEMVDEDDAAEISDEKLPEPEAEEKTQE